jgi:hypothetical protein
MCKISITDYSVSGEFGGCGYSEGKGIGREDKKKEREERKKQKEKTEGEGRKWNKRRLSKLIVGWNRKGR